MKNIKKTFIKATAFFLFLKTCIFFKKYTTFEKFDIKKEYNYKIIIPFSRKLSKFINKFNNNNKYKNVSKKKLFFKSDKLTTKANLFYNKEEKQGCIIYFHGGGFLFKGSKNTESKVIKLACSTNCKVISLDYELSNKYKYPTQINQCMDLLNYIYLNHEKLNIDLDKLILMGDSAGGNLAFITAYRLIKHKIDIKLVILLYPLLDSTMSTNSAKEFVKTPIINSNSLKEVWNLYLVNKNDYEYDIDKLDLYNFPKTYIEVAEFDPLKDEGYLLYNKLEKLNKEVIINMVNNAPHAYDSLDNTLKFHMEDRIKVINETINKGSDIY